MPRAVTAVLGGGRRRSSLNWSSGGWQLMFFVEPDRLREITRGQGRKYEGVRAGWLRWSSTMRAVPPVAETSTPTVDLDTPVSRTRPEPW
ncbi:MULTISPECIES: hypothetical protein [unclassified Rhodococcus (in: high G+C Gram-positive bacteria)]|uniref:hypothetical protein n=1 Tax=unclassified Rhodococcus (in: high G+C Gram-positive bacteria) TaxID=192944 RepID=UPI00200A8DF1|nr:hypothetical protein [Rhodococcus sp. HM1]MCK8671531.1 hypothetical protein [Rhodococcus sp. HM1]